MDGIRRTVMMILPVQGQHGKQHACQTLRCSLTSSLSISGFLCCCRRGGNWVGVVPTKAWNPYGGVASQILLINCLISTLGVSSPQIPALRACLTLWEGLQENQVGKIKTRSHEQWPQESWGAAASGSLDFCAALWGRTTKKGPKLTA